MLRYFSPESTISVTTEAGVPVAKLVRYTGTAARRTPGVLKGQIKIHEDFDEPTDIAGAFGIEP